MWFHAGSACSLATVFTVRPICFKLSARTNCSSAVHLDPKYPNLPRPRIPPYEMYSSSSPCIRQLLTSTVHSIRRLIPRNAQRTSALRRPSKSTRVVLHRLTQSQYPNTYYKGIRLAYQRAFLHSQLPDR